MNLIYPAIVLFLLFDFDILASCLRNLVNQHIRDYDVSKMLTCKILLMPGKTAYYVKNSTLIFPKLLKTPCRFSL